MTSRVGANHPMQRRRAICARHVDVRSLPEETDRRAIAGDLHQPVDGGSRRRGQHDQIQNDPVTVFLAAAARRGNLLLQERKKSSNS